MGNHNQKSNWQIAAARPTRAIHHVQNSRERVILLPLRLEHALQVYSLPLHHRDPFDRILVAQAQTENLPILTIDAMIRQYAVQTLW